MFVLLIKTFFFVKGVICVTFGTHSCVVSNNACPIIKEHHNWAFRKNSFCLWNWICNWF